MKCLKTNPLLLVLEAKKCSPLSTSQLTTSFRRTYSSSPSVYFSQDWMKKYSAELPWSARQALLQRDVLPHIQQAMITKTEGDDGLLPSPITNMYHELSRKKGSIQMSMLLRDDISSLLKNKEDLAAILSSSAASSSSTPSSSSSPLVSSSTSLTDKEIRQQLKYLDKVIQMFLHHSLCCYDSMTLQRITFEESSGLILERVAKGESVHRVRSIRELKRRLHDGKRCFALFHPAMKEDPLVFIHVALTSELSGSLR